MAECSCGGILEVYSADMWFCPECNSMHVREQEVISESIQEELFSPPPVSHLVSNDHPNTSVYAALKVRPKIGMLEQVVLDLLEAHPEGLTIHQMVDLSGLEYNSISPRPSKLVDKKLIYVSGEGVSPKGNRAQIYRLT